MSIIENIPEEENSGFQNPDARVPDIETQEQLNSETLNRRVEEENTPSADYGDADELINETSKGEEDLSGFLNRTLPDSDSSSVGADAPVTKNLEGDNLPGAEQASFEADEQNTLPFEKYDTNLIEGLRENIEKTREQLDLDNRLKGDSLD